ncbi:TIGR03620 family F420-dependent LLM class oxidoreductase [Microbacter sp. GSS18]|nr:TIGR03620 family F420-dependent LLM class oxidoreductase [Microbacter sp. GSS18]
MTTWSERLGTVGVWAAYTQLTPELAVDIERLGYGAIWQGGSPTADLTAAEELLDATESITVATGIVNIWRSEPRELADAYHRIVARHPGRLLVGVGSGHREGTPHRVRPVQAMSDYLDVLDEYGVPKRDRALSALGPRMLAMSAARSAGTHPYLTVPAQTAEGRAAVGPGALVAPEQTLVLESDTAAARAVARDFLTRYLRLANYAGNLLRAGFTEEDLAGGGSDRLIDDVIVHGDAATLAAAVNAHLGAGADHVCVQMLPAADDIRPALGAVAAEMGLAGA